MRSPPPEAPGPARWRAGRGVGRATAPGRLFGASCFEARGRVASGLPGGAARRDLARLGALRALAGSRAPPDVPALADPDFFLLRVATPGNLSRGACRRRTKAAMATARRPVRPEPPRCTGPSATRPFRSPATCELASHCNLVRSGYAQQCATPISVAARHECGASTNTVHPNAADMQRSEQSFAEADSNGSRTGYPLDDSSEDRAGALDAPAGRRIPLRPGTCQVFTAKKSGRCRGSSAWRQVSSGKLPGMAAETVFLP